MNKFRSKMVFSGEAPAVQNVSNAVSEFLSERKYKVLCTPLAGGGNNYVIRKGNFLLWFFGLSATVKLSISTIQNDDLVVELKSAWIGMHFTLLVLFLLMIPPLHIGILFVLMPIGWVFIATHITGIFLHILFREKLKRLISEYCLKNSARPAFCPECGQNLDSDGKCPNCRPEPKE